MRRQPDVKVWCFNVYNLFFFSFNAQATVTTTTISFFDAPRMRIRSSLIILTTFDRDVVILRLNRAVSVSPQSLVLG